MPQLNNKDTKTQRLETKEGHFTKAGSLHLAGEPKPRLELAVVRLLLRVFAPLLFPSYWGIQDG
jgi:hypothetical protein